MGEDRTRDPYGEPRSNQRLTVAQAAVSLGITEGAVRSRIKRGTLPTVKEGGNVYVVWDDSTSETKHPTNAAEASGEPSDQSDLIESVQDQVSYLRNQLEAEREAGRRKDHLLAAALERIPAIEAPQENPASPEPRESPQTPSEEYYGTSPQEAEDSLQRRPSWWRRFFGFE